MKILYAIQGTGNGHLSRARDIIPLLQQYGQVDILVSGTQSDVQLPYPVTYKSKGLSFLYNSKGGIHYRRTLQTNPPLRLLKDINDCPVKQYDLVINDFEPISAWACKYQGKPCVALGHQASFLSAKTPRPRRKDILGEFVLHHYAPSTKAFGFHFEKYDDFIFPPVIRSEIREGHHRDLGHITAYLPSVGDERLIGWFRQFPDFKWELFSRYCKTPYRKGNVEVFPVSNDRFIDSFLSCHAIFTGAGFETPAEALYMGKKLMVVPVKGQYEQQCNAAALEKMGVPVIWKLRENIPLKIHEWLRQPAKPPVLFPQEAQEVVARIIDASQSPAEPILSLTAES
ncbi:MAG: glycosyltransferase family protein [Bacteroidota bacterium]